MAAPRRAPGRPRSRAATLVLLAAIFLLAPAASASSPHRGRKAPKTAAAGVAPDGSISAEIDAKTAQKQAKKAAKVSLPPDDLPPDATALWEEAAAHKANLPQTALHLYRRALAAVEAGTAGAGDSADLHFELGNLLLEHGGGGGAGEAVAHLRAGMALEPGLPEAAVSVGAALASLGDARGSARALRRALKVAGLDADLKSKLKSGGGAGGSGGGGSGAMGREREKVVRGMLATAYEEAGQGGKALAQWRWLLAQGATAQERKVAASNPGLNKLQKRDPLLLMGVGRGMASQGKYEEAEELFREACEVYPTGECREALVDAQYRIGKDEEAAKSLAKAMQKVNKKVAAHYKGPLLKLSPRLHDTVATEPEGNIALPDGRVAKITQHGTRPGPEVFTIENFMSHKQVDRLVDLYTARQARKRPDPIVCFTQGSPQMASFLARMRKESGNQDDMLRPLKDPKFGTRMCANLTDEEPGFQEAFSNLKFSDSTFVYRHEDPLVDDLESRIAQIVGLLPQHGLSTQFLSYDEGVDYADHTDCSPRLKAADRAYTILLYLTDVEEGGETVFPELGIEIPPQKGTLAIFSSFRSENGWCDFRSRHASKAVKSGHKIVVQKWYIQRSMNDIVAKRYGDKMAVHTAPDQPSILCDKSSSCRQYFPFSSAEEQKAAAARNAQKSAKA